MTSQRSLANAQRFILEHTKVSWLIWILAWAFLVPVANLAPLREPSRFGILAWFTVFELVTVPVSVVLIGRRLKTRDTPALALQWILAQVPLLASFAAVFDRTPQWLGSVALVEAVALMMYSTRRARKRQLDSPLT